MYFHVDSLLFAFVACRQWNSHPTNSIDRERERKKKQQQRQQNLNMLVRLMHRKHMKCEINRMPWHTKTVIRTHKYRKNELLLWKRDRKLELFTLRHLHNGKQYFWIHCTCSAPRKQIFAMEQSESPECERKKLAQFMCVLIRQMLSHSRTITHMVAFSCCFCC